MNRVVKKIQKKYFPTERQKEYQRWIDDQGDERLRLEYDLGANSLVMDLGGYKGQWASDIHSRFGCRVLVFEPMPQFAEQIEHRFARNGLISVFAFALGRSKRRESLVVAGDSSSVHLGSGDQVSVQFEDVADFFAKSNIQECDLMKINIEGGEYELLDRMLETGLVEKVKNLQIQFHDLNGDSESEMKRICSSLSKTHRPTYQYKFVWENWERNGSRAENSA